MIFFIFKRLGTPLLSLIWGFVYPYNIIFIILHHLFYLNFNLSKIIQIELNYSAFKLVFIRNLNYFNQTKVSSLFPFSQLYFILCDFILFKINLYKIILLFKVFN